MPDFDLVIVGGGCAGLSLARELARKSDAPRTAIIEPRSRYVNDRTWCFWERPQHPFSHLVSHRWPGWEFSSGSDRVHRRSAGHYTYQRVPAGAFYDDALVAIDRNPKLALMTGVEASDVRSSGEAVTIDTSTGPITAGFCVDTRHARAPSVLLQEFEGAVVDTGRVTFDGSTVGLMCDLRYDNDGLRFVYRLPLSSSRALIETTRFSTVPVGRSRLRAELVEDIATSVDAARYDILYREHGVIPMGMALDSELPSERLCYAGTPAGAVRAATGYAFQRIARWSRLCADSLLSTGRPVSHPREPAWRRRMDRLLLEVLREYPSRGPELFMAMGVRVPSDALVRFMSDRARPGDIARVIAALPPGPFLRQLLARRRSRLSKPVQQC